MCVSAMIEETLHANPQPYSLGSPWDEVSTNYISLVLRI